MFTHKMYHLLFIGKRRETDKTFRQTCKAIKIFALALFALYLFLRCVNHKKFSPYNRTGSAVNQIAFVHTVICILSPHRTPSMSIVHSRWPQSTFTLQIITIKHTLLSSFRYIKLNQNKTINNKNRL